MCSCSLCPARVPVFASVHVSEPPLHQGPPEYGHSAADPPIPFACSDNHSAGAFIIWMPARDTACVDTAAAADSVVKDGYLIAFAVISPPKQRRPIPANALPRSHSFPPSPPGLLWLIGFKVTCRPPSSWSAGCSGAPPACWERPAANPATINPVRINLKVCILLYSLSFSQHLLAVPRSSIETSNRFHKCSPGWLRPRSSPTVSRSGPTHLNYLV